MNLLRQCLALTQTRNFLLTIGHSFNGMRAYELRGLVLELVGSGRYSISKLAHFTSSDPPDRSRAVFRSNASSDLRLPMISQEACDALGYTAPSRL
jgi:hypothetical protein